jgi:hypothetical protein
MEDFIRRILKEYFDESIQRVRFDGFSDPILIPQFNKYIVKFNGTSSEEKLGDSEKIIFTDNSTGKEYIFNADDVQKSGRSPFYINLDVLRRNYNITFNDEMVRYKKTLSTKESTRLFNDSVKDYISDGRCKTKKCEDLRNTIESSLIEIYGKDYGSYVPTSCEPTQGFLNVYPIDGTLDNNKNKWSKLNYVIFREESAYTLVLSYIKKYGTFEHTDFIDWVKKDKERLFKGPFLDLMLRNINIPKPNKILGENLMDFIRKVFPDAKLIDSFCPTTRKEYSETITIISNGEKIIFQPVEIKHRAVLNINGKYYLSFGRRKGSPNINRNADYIITNNGTIYKNSNVVSGQRVWEFNKPPIYSIYPVVTELTGREKLK